MKATQYFLEQVLRKRTEIDVSWCLPVIRAPVSREQQSNGRMRYWGKVIRPGETVPRYLRVVTLEDGETIHKAFFDRNFPRNRP